MFPLFGRSVFPKRHGAKARRAGGKQRGGGGWAQLLLIVKRRIKKGERRRRWVDGRKGEGGQGEVRGSGARSNNKNSSGFVFRRRGRSDGTRKGKGAK